MQNTNLIVTKTLLAQATDLAEAYEKLVLEFVVGGRKALYTSLAEIMKLVLQVNASIEKKALIDEIRQKLLNEYNIKTQANSSVTAILVKYITRADRKTTHVYARAIDTAIANNIEPEHFIEFVEKEGGIEQIRATGVDAEVKEIEKKLADEYIELTHDYLNARIQIPLDSFYPEKQLKNFLTTSKSTYQLLVCRFTENQVRVLMPVPDNVDFEERAVKIISEVVFKDWEDNRKGALKIIESAKISRAEERGARIERERAKAELEKQEAKQ